MLTDNMNLRQMIDFQPNEEDMAMLDLDVVVYAKASIISMTKQDNYDFIRFLFTEQDFNIYFKQYEKTVFYDFDGTRIHGEKFVTVFELYSLYNFANTSDYLKEVLETYTHEADVIIDLYTHDDEAYRLSNLEAIVKLEKMGDLRL